MRKQYYDTREAELEDDEEYEGPSKSQLKRESEALQDLGKELTLLKPEQLEKVPLPEDLSMAIADYKKIRTFGAQRRQLQFIGKIMRRMDYAAVREAIDRATGASRAAVLAEHRSTAMRDALIADDKAMTAFIAKHPQADVQAIRTLVRQARKEKTAGVAPKSSRQLYRAIYAMELPDLDLLARQDEPDEMQS